MDGAEILQIINRGLHVDGGAVRASDVVGSVPDELVRTTLAMVISKLEK